MLLAAAAGTVGALALGANQIRGRGQHSVVGAATTSGAPGRPSTTAENIRAAQAEVDRLITLVPLLPGGQTDGDPPRAAFAALPFRPLAGGDHLVEREVFLRKRDVSVDAVAGFYEKSAPRELVTGSSEGVATSRPARITSITVTYELGDSKHDTAYAWAGVDIDLIPVADGVAVRVRARALARPGRAEGGFVTGDVTAVDVRPTIELPKLAPRNQRPPATPAIITDPVLIAELVTTLNALPMSSRLTTSIAGAG